MVTPIIFEIDRSRVDAVKLNSAETALGINKRQRELVCFSLAAMQDSGLCPVNKISRGLQGVDAIGRFRNPNARPTIRFPTLQAQPGCCGQGAAGHEKWTADKQQANHSFHSEPTIRRSKQGSRKNCMSVIIQHTTEVLF